MLIQILLFENQAIFNLSISFLRRLCDNTQNTNYIGFVWVPLNLFFSFLAYSSTVCRGPWCCKISFSRSQVIVRVCIFPFLSSPNLIYKLLIFKITLPLWSPLLLALRQKMANWQKSNFPAPLELWTVSFRVEPKWSETITFLFGNILIMSGFRFPLGTLPSGTCLCFCFVFLALIRFLTNWGMTSCDVMVSNPAEFVFQNTFGSIIHFGHAAVFSGHPPPLIKCPWGFPSWSLQKSEKVSSL